MENNTKNILRTTNNRLYTDIVKHIVEFIYGTRANAVLFERRTPNLRSNARYHISLIHMVQDIAINGDIRPFFAKPKAVLGFPNIRFIRRDFMRELRIETIRSLLATIPMHAYLYKRFFMRCRQLHMIMQTDILSTRVLNSPNPIKRPILYTISPAFERDSHPRPQYSHFSFFPAILYLVFPWYFFISMLFSRLFRQHYHPEIPTEKWLEHMETAISNLSLRRGQRVIERHLSRKVREIHRRFSSFYTPYQKHTSWLNRSREDAGTSSLLIPPDTLLLATRWLLKKHAAIAAEFRSLEATLSKVSFDETAPANLIAATYLLNGYVEKTAFRFSEETLASTLNDWQESAAFSLSLAETEAISPILRLLSLDKLSTVAIRLADVEKSRALARKHFNKFGPNSSRYHTLIDTLRRKRGPLCADAFADAFEECRSKEVYPLSRFRETSSKKNEERPVKSFSRTAETKSLRELATRVRVLLRSLPLLGEFEWNALLRKTNALHRLLVRDPADIYEQMTSLSQEMYRKKAASIAKTLRLSEETFTRAALALAEEHKNSSDPQRHVGFYLVDDGLPALLKRLTGSTHMSWWHWYHDRRKLPAIRVAYFGFIFSLSLFTASIFAVFYLHYRFLMIIAFPILYKASKHLVDSLFVGVVPPTFLPRLNFRRRIPESASAVFVIPALLKDRHTLSALLGKLETAYLSNTTSALSYYLLLDYTDAASETMPEDTSLLQETKDAFCELNQRYGETDRFAFVIRSRAWSNRQGRWMGWERKRGKLLDFARALRGQTTSSPFFISAKRLPHADFIITLDEDAFITRDFIKDMLGIHSHPLQKPILNTNDELIRGYTFIQPHVKQWFKNRHRFRLPRIFFDEKRFSAYSTTFPEIYQDIFLEGSYAGKGSFHIDAFLSALDGALPTDQILSHDLLEGSLARTAYAADIDVFDEFPKSLRAMLARNHRWTRGDWQILDWLTPTVRDESGRARKNTLAFVHRFKIADNLLQSLFRPAVFLITVLSWIVGNPHLLLFAWSIFLLDLFLLDMCIDWIRWSYQLLTGKWKHIGYRLKRTATRSFRLCRQVAFECITLPYAALDTVHAIITAISRRFISKKNMLEWVPSAHFENPAGRIPLLFPCITLLIVLLNFHTEGNIHPLFALLLVLWTGIPILVFLLNKPYKQAHDFSRQEEDSLRRDALETWNFFEQTVGPETHFLPPDYIRTSPTAKTAEYTSITNIGFFLTSVLVAHRLGFISAKKAYTSLERTCASLEHMERYQGHFYNWYHTKTALPAPPLFISSVDSGNLRAALIVTRQWLAHETTTLSVHRTEKGLHSMAQLIRDRIPKTLDMQSFSDIWETVISRIDTLPLNHEESSFFEQLRIIETSLIDIAIPKSLPEEVRHTLALLREQLRDTISEYQYHLSNKQTNASPNTAGHTDNSHSDLIRKLDSIISEMRFDFLRSNKRSLISIGFHVPTKRLENRFYQTLASEARIANLLALAEGALSFRGWNKLNRTVLPLRTGPALISWTGTLFEYLMPALFLEEHKDSLVGRSIQTAILMNRYSAKKKNIPAWGLSESGYAELDRGGNFRYKPFGLPALSLSPSADDRSVVSAYGIAMSISSFPRIALKNLTTYASYGGRGIYGYIEAIDFHRSRHGSPVNMFMSHHQGMILAAIGNCLSNRLLSRLFESHPLVQNSLFVLDEGIPPIDKEPFPRPAAPYLHTALSHPRTP